MLQLSTGSSSLTSATAVLMLTVDRERHAGSREHSEGQSSVHVSNSVSTCVSVAEPATLLTERVWDGDSAAEHI